MRQKLSDFMLKLKADRKTQVITILGVLAVLFLMFYEQGPRAPSYRRLHTNDGTGAMGTEEAYQDLLTRFGEDFQRVQGDVKSLQGSVDQQREDFREFEQRTAEIFKKVLERISVDGNGSGRGGAGADPTDIYDENVTGVNLNQGDMATQQQTDALEQFGLEPQEVVAPPAPDARKVAFVGAGDSVRVKLLAGVNAPTDGTPYPVVFKLVSDVYGPDGSALPLGEARIIAAAQGSLTDSRALFRLTSMNVRFPDGRRKVVPVDGWVVGEDGVRGMSGILIDPIGKAIAGAGMVGALSGAGQAISSANSTTLTGLNTGTQSTVVTGNTGEFAAGQALSSAANTWSSIIRERLNQMVPVVQVLSGREATAVFAQSVQIPDLFEALEADEDSIEAGLG